MGAPNPSPRFYLPYRAIESIKSKADRRDESHSAPTTKEDTQKRSKATKSKAGARNGKGRYYRQLNNTYNPPLLPGEQMASHAEEEQAARESPIYRRNDIATSERWPSNQ